MHLVQHWPARRSWRSDGPDAAPSNWRGGSRARRKADGRRRGTLRMRLRSRRRGRKVLRKCSEGGEGARKADKRRTEGGSHRPVSAPSMWIVCHEALRGEPVHASSSCQTVPDGVSPNTEGGQTADGRWNPPTNFGPFVGDLLDMRNSAPIPRPQLSGAIGGRLWPPPHEGTVALEEMGS